MAKFALLMPREEMVQPAGRIARELGLDVVLNRSCATERVMELVEEGKQLGADIIVARGRQASIIKENADLPVVEIQLTGQEIALCLRRARDLVPRVQRPKIGIVTLPNMIGEVHCFEEVLDITLRTYFVSATSEMQGQVERAVAEGMNVILGGDYVNACCRKLGKRTLFLESTDDSLRTSLRQAKSIGFAADVEQRNTARLQVLLDYSFNGIFELDDLGTILRVNDVACKILGKGREELEGRPLAQFMPDNDAELWSWALAERQDLSFSLLELAGVEVVANAAPVGGWPAAGIVFSFYELRRVERQEARALRERYRLQRYLAKGQFENVTHKSRQMEDLIKLARTFAGTDLPVLICGETGSGKSLFAQSIHNAGNEPKGPFVAFSCASGGTAQGDALALAGKAADTGTLYLEHIDQLSGNGQHILDRLLREQVVQPPDLPHPELVRVRVVASLDGRLEGCREAGTFLPRLYYRLSALQLVIPPLRDRPEDLDQAIDLFLDGCVSKFNRYVVLTREARQLLLDCPWPGNYVQLQGFLERMALTARSRTVGVDYVQELLGQLGMQEARKHPGGDPDPAQPEEELIRAILNECGGNRTAAADRLGISKTTLWRRLKKYGITTKGSY